MRCGQVFAEGLNVPTSIVFANGGVIVAHAPDFLFLQDTDGDDVADVREVLNTGWGVVDTHAGPSNLHMVWTIAFGARWATPVIEVARERMRFASGTASFT